MYPAHGRCDSTLTPDTFFPFTLKMKPRYGTAVLPPEPAAPTAQASRKGALVWQDVHFQHALSICRAPVQACAWFQSCFSNYFGRDSHLILARYSCNHGINVILDK
jgi:hypothetical protein